MIYETGRVLERRGNTALVLCQSAQACPRCASGKGCGGALWGRLLGNRLHRVSAHTTVPGVAAGDSVLIGLDESALVKAAACLYGLPLLVMLTASILAHIVAPDSELSTVLWAAVGLCAGILLARAVSRRAGHHAGYRPVVIRRLHHGESQVGAYSGTSGGQ